MSYYRNFATKVRASDIYKRSVVRDAIKKVAPYCKGNFEIPIAAIVEINKGNVLRKKPIRASREYVASVMYQMLNLGEI